MLVVHARRLPGHCVSPNFGWVGYLKWMSYQQKVPSFSKTASIRVHEGSPDAAVCFFAADRSVESMTRQ